MSKHWEWVSVSDELPPDGWKGKVRCEARWKSRASYNGDEGAFSAKTSGALLAVTHWRRRLPAPPPAPEFKVGDEVLVKGKIHQIDDNPHTTLPYLIEWTGTTYLSWCPAKSLLPAGLQP